MILSKKQKAQLQIQFAWIFVIIVGVAFLLFFFSIIGSQAKTSSQKISINLAKHFETILTTTGQKAGTVKQYTIPLAEVSFVCDSREGLFSYSVNDIEAKNTKYDVIFSPKKLYDQRIYTWTLDWNVPFSVTTFLYVSSKNHAYIFLNSSSDLTKEVEDYFAKNFTILNMYQDGTSITNQPTKNLNYDFYTYIFDENELDKLINAGFEPVEKNSVIIFIQPGSGIRSVFDHGSLYYLTANDWKIGNIDPNVGNPFEAFASKQTNYLGKASLYGGLFSENVQSYECAMTKALRKYKILTLLQYYKVENVMPSVNAYCQQPLGGFSSSNGAKQILEQVNTTIDTGISTDSFKTLWGLQKELDERNRQLSVEGNCPLIY